MIYSKGSNAAEIGIIQNNLKMLGYDPKGIDCLFGENTEIAVKEFQSSNDLISDGIVGNHTWNTLIEKVKNIQTSLNSLNFNLIVDGIAGLNTYNALLKFQEDNNLAPDGIVGIKTRTALFEGSSNNSSNFNISENGINFIADYENFYPTPYERLDYQNQTIGYGHVITSGENFKILTEYEAKTLLKNDLKKFVYSVNTMVSALNLTQFQFDALVSFAYNCGANALKYSILLKDIKANASIETIKEDFLMWCNCNGKRELGLYRRRYDEFEMYSNADYTRTYREF